MKRRQFRGRSASLGAVELSQMVQSAAGADYWLMEGSPTWIRTTTKISLKNQYLTDFKTVQISGTGSKWGHS